MTPTEQDNELREKIADIFDELCEPTNEFWHRDSGLHWADKVMQLITADRKRVALEARIDELNSLPHRSVTALTSSVDQSVIYERLAELKAQQEEV